MARWEGNTRGRLERAALDLFTEQGYDRTTVAEIARRAGLTERSFYRWYTDKREALFGGGQELEELLVAAVAEVPEGTAPLDTLLRAFTKAPEVFRPREFLRARAAVIAASPPLRERELIKTASMSAALKKALENRGHPPAPRPPRDRRGHGDRAGRGGAVGSRRVGGLRDAPARRGGGTAGDRLPLSPAGPEAASARSGSGGGPTAQSSPSRTAPCTVGTRAT
ncbi:transcriptional regulator, TetR family [Streptomyces sp. SolWspMP-sol7th]|uniref:TetR/AcrR family transcriptional regulator n=1 Tax=Streptomyces sp. SolWspMP-sol7th TaxID=1839776 RepID=UPI00081E01BD|nr:TetR/AcrR family transcriptional regulator [Streptomyces sp. SolWspMP-sol7th]SCE14492.1 transcriptional regulator, TetR family [Streptomyces sp. SolWspMP-sol7th]